MSEERGREGTEKEYAACLPVERASVKACMRKCGC